MKVIKLLSDKKILVLRVNLLGSGIILIVLVIVWKSKYYLEFFIVVG